jgi:hypothetical protein
MLSLPPFAIMTMVDSKTMVVGVDADALAGAPLTTDMITSRSRRAQVLDHVGTDAGDVAGFGRFLVYVLEHGLGPVCPRRALPCGVIAHAVILVCHVADAIIDLCSAFCDTQYVFLISSNFIDHSDKTWFIPFAHVVKV